jgi:hypothetical protein
LKKAKLHKERATQSGSSRKLVRLYNCGEFDRWDERGIKFIFGMNAHRKVVELAEDLPEGTWKPLERLPSYEIAIKAPAQAQAGQGRGR